MAGIRRWQAGFQPLGCEIQKSAQLHRQGILTVMDEADRHGLWFVGLQDGL